MKQKQELKHEIPIFFTADNGYVPYLAVAIKSLTENASPDYKYSIIVLHEKISKKNIETLKTFENEYVSVSFYEMENRIEGITDRMSNRLRCDYFTLTIYFRLFIPTMFPEYNKGIYIDSDIVVPGDISKLYEVELGNNLIGACRDFSIQKIPELCNYMDHGVGVGREKYINSGVLLMNMKRLREVELDKEFLRLLNTYHFDTIAPDQDYLNVMCNGSITYLDECWDAMPKDGKKELENPMLIHYNLFSKPWCYDGVQYEEYFWKYAKETPYMEEIVKHKENYSDEQKASDQNCLEVLIRHSGEIAEEKENFCTVYESGREHRLQ